MRQNLPGVLAIARGQITFQQITKRTAGSNCDGESQNVQAKHARRNDEQLERKRRRQDRSYQHRQHLIAIEQVFDALLLRFGKTIERAMTGLLRNLVKTDAADRRTYGGRRY